MIKKIVIPLLFGSAISLTLLGMLSIGMFESWQEKLSDNLFLHRNADPNIVIIAIDDKSLNKIGRWPWNRKIHVELLRKLKTLNPKPKIGFDISFFEPSNSNDDLELANALDENIVLAAEISREKTLLPLEILRSKARTGISNTIIDSDGISRKIDPDGSFAQVISQSKAQLPNPMRVNFVGGPGTFTTYSYSDVLDPEFETSIFNGKIVLVGATALDLHDNQIVPTSAGKPMAGVEIHANAIQTIMDAKFLSSELKEMTIFTIIILTLTLSLVLSRFPIRVGVIISTGTLIAYLIYSIFLFDQGVIVNLIYPPLAIMASFVISIIYKYLTESKQKRFLKKAFSYYLADDVVNEIVTHPEKLKLGGEKKTLTILFSDIAGFTSISEKLGPEKLTSLLNKYLTQMTEIILKNRGVVDKFIGDSIMAFWGAPIPNPNHALLACKSALEMKRIKVGKFTSRIGINTGEAIVGNMGSQARFDYTALGDNVNIASRLEGQNKTYGTTILISESTYKLVKNKVIAKYIDSVVVKGKTKPVKVYELLNAL